MYAIVMKITMIRQTPDQLFVCCPSWQIFLAAFVLFSGLALTLVSLCFCVNYVYM